MKKSLLIVSHALELGGVERSLIGLLDALNPEEWDIDLFLLRHEGELMNLIPDYVRLLPEVPAYTVLARPMTTTLKEGHFVLTAARLIGKISAKLYNRKHGLESSDVPLEYSHKFTCPLMPKISPDKEYDLAISFLTPHYFVDRKVRAKKKIAWIHTDYSGMQINLESETSMWNVYDFIASISEAVTTSFSAVFPSLKKKIVLIENILPERLVKYQAGLFDVEAEMPVAGIRLLSVGRYCSQKNFDNVPDICSRLIQSGLDIYWYIIGFGPDEQLIRQKIAQAGMQDRVILLGPKANPYPYIAGCDLYVQPSRYEGKSVTVREAQMLGKPVVITDYPTSVSQLEHNADGVIVPLENEACANGIAALLRDPQKMEKLIQTCLERDYSNRKEVGQLSRLMERNED